MLKANVHDGGGQGLLVVLLSCVHPPVRLKRILRMRVHSGRKWTVVMVSDVVGGHNACTEETTSQTVVLFRRSSLKSRSLVRMLCAVGGRVCEKKGKESVRTRERKRERERERGREGGGGGGVTCVTLCVCACVCVCVRGACSFFICKG